MAYRNVSLRLINCFNKKQVINNGRSIHGIQLNSIQQCSKVNGLKLPSNLWKSLLQDHHNLNDITTKRWGYDKKSKSKNKYDSDDEDKEEDENESELKALVKGNKNAKIVSTTLNSMRIDAVVKAGFAISRNKAETVLYESKLRVNNQRVAKKGQQIGINDVIDMVLGPSPQNPNFLLVNRITVIDADLNEDNYKVKILREKNLLIDNYEHSWKEPSDG